MVISGYAPPNDTAYVSPTCANDYMDQLMNLVKKKNHHKFIIVNDMNPRTGLLPDY